MNNDKLGIKELHEVGFSGIIKILKIKGTFKKFPFYGSLILSVLIVALISSFHAEILYSYLQITAEILVAFFPSLLGFSLGGYALVVGFSNVDLIKKGSSIEKHSLYQILNAIFSLSIIFQVFTTILCLSVNWFIKVNFSVLVNNNIETFNNSINAVVLFFLLFGSIYSLCLTPYVVTNLFTLSQLNNLHLTVEQIDDVASKQALIEKSDESAKPAT